MKEISTQLVCLVHEAGEKLSAINCVKSFREKLLDLCELNGIDRSEENWFSIVNLYKDGQDINFFGFTQDGLMVNNKIAFYLPTKLFEGHKTGDVITIRIVGECRPEDKRDDTSINDPVLITAETKLQIGVPKRRK